VAVALAALGGCADRGLASGPERPPGTGTWAVVTVAALAITLVLAALIVLPANRPGGSRVASWILAVQAGGVAVAAAIVVGAAVRSEQLLGREPDAEQAASLLRLSVLDGGDGGFFDLVVVVTVLLGGLLVAALVLAAWCAADDDPLERWLVTGLLGAEVLASVACAVLVVIGFRHAGFVLPALSLPVLVAATTAAWPRRRLPEPEGPPGG
jgi:hypothetical protein